MTLWNFVRSFTGFPASWGNEEYHIYDILRKIGFNSQDAIARTNDEKPAREKMRQYYRATRGSNRHR